MKSINAIYPQTAFHISALSPSPVFAQKEHNPQKTESAPCRDAFPQHFTRAIKQTYISKGHTTFVDNI